MLTLVISMFLSGFAIIFLSMQKYISPSDYVLFLMEDKLSGIIFNTPYQFDISPIVSLVNKIGGFIPYSIRFIGLALKGLEGIIYSALDKCFY